MNTARLTILALLLFACAPSAKTVRFDTLDGVNVHNVAVPAATSSVSLWRNNVSDVGVTLWFFDANGGAIYTYLLQAGDVMFNTVPLSNDVKQVGVQKISGASTRARLFFWRGK